MEIQPLRARLDTIWRDPYGVLAVHATVPVCAEDKNIPLSRRRFSLGSKGGRRSNVSVEEHGSNINAENEPKWLWNQNQHATRQNTSTRTPPQGPHASPPSVFPPIIVANWRQKWEKRHGSNFKHPSHQMRPCHKTGFNHKNFIFFWIFLTTEGNTQSFGGFIIL